MFYSCYSTFKSKSGVHVIEYECLGGCNLEEVKRNFIERRTRIVNRKYTHFGFAPIKNLPRRKKKAEIIDIKYLTK